MRTNSENLQNSYSIPIAHCICSLKSFYYNHKVLTEQSVSIITLTFLMWELIYRKMLIIQLKVVNLSLFSGACTSNL